MTIVEQYSRFKAPDKKAEGYWDVPELLDFVNVARNVGEIAGKIIYVAQAYADNAYANKRMRVKFMKNINKRNMQALKYLKQTFVELDRVANVELYKGVETRILKRRKRRNTKAKRSNRDVSWNELKTLFKKGK